MENTASAVPDPPTGQFATATRIPVGLAQLAMIRSAAIGMKQRVRDTGAIVTLRPIWHKQLGRVTHRASGPQLPRSRLDCALMQPASTTPIRNEVVRAHLGRRAAAPASPQVNGAVLSGLSVRRDSPLWTTRYASADRKPHGLSYARPDQERGRSPALWSSHQSVLVNDDQFARRHETLDPEPDHVDTRAPVRRARGYIERARWMIRAAHEGRN